MARVFAIQVQSLIEAGYLSRYTFLIVSRSESCKNRDKLITPTVRVSKSAVIFFCHAGTVNRVQVFLFFVY